ncbi:MAG: 50S ribosomal protein L6 [Mycoplasmataceae bacterium]|jgi:large subunit ribosomal protein L6|nr:50S ribosomal protein L6 [Mycoplasmataceae bacterium]
MSRKGNKVIHLPQGVTVQINPTDVNVNGSGGALVVNYPNDILVITNENGQIRVTPKTKAQTGSIFQGTVYSHLNNAIAGVSTGFKKHLKIVGVGYKAALSGNQLTLAIGFSHPVVFTIPSNLKVVCPTATEIIITGNSKQAVGQFAAQVRAVREPEPYNGKGIMYSDEIIVRKVGKTAEGASGGGGGASAAPKPAAKGAKK